MSRTEILESVKEGRLLYRGGEAEIYSVELAGKKYALKWYEAGIHLNFTMVKTLETLRHPGLYRIVESGRLHERPVVVYEFLEGVSSNAIQSMPPLYAVDALYRIVQALLFLKERGLYHGDLNPNNVILTPRAEPVLIDCGIVGLGVPFYAAPERFRGAAASEKADLFSLGLLLYGWIAGETLWRGADFETLMKQCCAVDEVDVAARLYALCGSPVCQLKPEMLSALQPLWGGLLREKPEDRLEDLDELAERLEIARDALGGAVELERAREMMSHQVSLLIGKTGTETPAVVKLPFVDDALAVSAPGWRKYKVLLWFLAGLIFVVAGLLIFSSQDASGVDETGLLFLQKSRTQEPMTNPATMEMPDMEGVLKDLPVPEGSP